LQPLHRRRKVRFFGLDQQVVVVAHEYIGKDTQPEPLRAPAQPVEKALVIALIAKDGSPLIAAIEHVVERIPLIDAQRSCHEWQSITARRGLSIE
jgi:hypothetical protein